MPQNKLKLVGSIAAANAGTNEGGCSVIPAIATANSEAISTADDTELEEYFSGLTGCMEKVLSALVNKYKVGEPFRIKIKDLAKSVEIDKDTAQRILTKFDKEDCLNKRRYRNGRYQGLEIMLNPVCSWYRKSLVRAKADATANATMNSNSIVNSNYKTTYSENAQRILDVKDEDIASHYPALAKTGFGAEQLRQIVEHRNKLDISLAGVLHSLEYAEYMLKKDLFKDKFGGAIKNYNGFIFKILRDSGFISKPQGFKTVQECVAEEAEERLRAIKDAKKREMDALHEGWLLELSSEERDELLKNKIGPEEVFLRNYWKSNVLNHEGGGNDRA